MPSARAPTFSSTTIRSRFHDRSGAPTRSHRWQISSAAPTTIRALPRRLVQPQCRRRIPTSACTNILSAPVPLVTLVNLTTMDRNIQNAHSRQGSLELERQLGEGATYSVGYQYVGGRNLLISVNQNVPTCVAVGTNNGCRPNP